MGEAYIVRRGGGTGSMRKPPEYTYSGVSEFVDETADGSAVNWLLKLKTSGVLRFDKLNNAKNGLEIFIVGGGGGGGKTRLLGGGGGGYVSSFEFTPEQGTEYQALIGNGGQPDTDGGATSIFGETAEGGHTAGKKGEVCGGAGGSGGGAYNWGGHGAFSGGSNGSKGGGDGTGYGTGNDYMGGAGAGVTTIPWNDKITYGIYAGGGGGANGGVGASSSTVNYAGAGGEGGGGKGSPGGTYGTSKGGTSGATNTGGGGGGGNNADGSAGNSGGSGIILIRNKRVYGGEE